MCALLCGGRKNLVACGSPVVKVSDRGKHTMSSSPIPLKTRRVGQRCTENLSRAETSTRWYGVVVRRGGVSSASAVPTQEKFIEENVRIKNAIAAAVPTQEKFIEENVHIEVQKNIYQQFQQTRLPFNRHSRTPGHERLSTSRMEKNKKNDVWSVLILGFFSWYKGTSEDLTLAGVHLVMQTRPNAPETTMA
ncbi:hypothetical protein TNCV_744211 [Trichonephila clavipes]|nr:hypothetical protein TNCV_744211 [Trichonephila clavipes]